MKTLKSCFEWRKAKSWVGLESARLLFSLKLDQSFDKPVIFWIIWLYVNDADILRVVVSFFLKI